MKLILKSHAGNISTEASSSLLLEDIRRNSPSTMDVKTFESYIEALHDLLSSRISPHGIRTSVQRHPSVPPTPAISSTHRLHAAC